VPEVTEDEAIMRRARPLLLEAIQRQKPDVGPALERAVSTGALGVEMTHDQDGRLWLVFDAGGAPFCQIQAENVGLHEIAGEELIYLRDPLLDDDLE
jgi:hypothetical protein